MANKDTFDLKGFLVENKLTESSRKNDLRVHFGDRKLLKEGQNGNLDEIRNISAYDTEWLPAGELARSHDGFVDPEDLAECDGVDVLGEAGDDESDLNTHWDVASIRRFYTDMMNAYNAHNRAVSSGKKQGQYINDVEDKVFDRIQREYGDPYGKKVPINRIFKDRITARNADRAASQVAVTRFSPRTKGGSYDKTDNYTGTPTQDNNAPSIITGKKQRAAWKEKYDRFGDKLTNLSELATMDEADFNDVANSVASQVKDYDDEDSTQSGMDSPTGAAFGATTETPEDFSRYDERSIRQSYQSLKNQKVSDDKAMKILSRTYDIPEQDLRMMFRDVFVNAKQAPIQTDDPKEAPRMQLSKKKARDAAEIAAARDMATSGDFDDSELDKDDTVEKGDSGEDEEPEDDTPVDKSAPDYREVHIPDNLTLNMSEKELQKYLNGFKQPEKATSFLQRAINTAQKAAAAKGTGNLYLYLGTDGYYHPLTSQISLGDTFNYKRGEAEYSAKAKKFMGTLDCSTAYVPGGRGKAIERARTVAAPVEDADDDNPTELTASELRAITQSPRWAKMSLKDKIQDPAWKYSDEYREMSGDDEDEPVDDKFAKDFANDEEEPLDLRNPDDLDWAIKWATKRK